MSLNNLISQLYSNIALGQKLDVIMPLVKSYNNTDWKEYINFSERRYTRNLVYKSDLFDVYIICWNNKQESPIHDHASNGCVMKILQGLNCFLYYYSTLLKKQLRNDRYIYVLDVCVTKKSMCSFRSFCFHT